MEDAAEQRAEVFEEIEDHIDDHIEQINDFGDDLNDVSNTTIQEAIDNTLEEIQIAQEDDQAEYEYYYYPETGQSLAARRYNIAKRLQVVDSMTGLGVAGAKFEIKNNKGLKLKYTTDYFGYTPYIYLTADDTFYY